MTFGRTGLLLAVALAGCTSAWGGSQALFLPQDNRLVIRSPVLEVILQAGAVTSVKDLTTGEVFSSGDPGEAWQLIPRGSTTVEDSWQFASGWKKDPREWAQDQALQAARRRPDPEGVPEYRQLGPTCIEAVYRGFPGAETGDELRYRAEVDPHTGDVLLQALSRQPSTPQPVLSLDLPLLNLRGKSVVLGCGAQYTREHSPRVDYCVRWANNLYSPLIALIEGERGWLAVWRESVFTYGNLSVAHSTSADSLILTATRDPRETERGTLASGRWRISVHSSWVAAARQYRAQFETETGAKPLWENPCPWVRKIHAVHTEVPSPQDAPAYYADLAQRVDPAKLLLFYWNGDRIVLFGDHRYSTTARPAPQAIAALKQHGFRWLGYHPWVLVMPPAYSEQRLQDLAAKGWLPEGYRFNPDYDGPPDRFHDHFRPIAAGYYAPLDEASLWLLHPGAKTFQQYFARNFANYCHLHQMDGAYLDVAGCDGGHHFPPDRKVIDGLTYRQGEEQALRESQAAHPELTLMSEVQGEWIMNRVFYTWEGGSHLNLPRAYPSVETMVNHPLRAALWGSYTWCREEGIDPAHSALLACLPELVLGDEWSEARARLFTEEELFNDLPPTWDEPALAYYRGRGGRWFQFRRMPFGDAFVEQDGTNLRTRLGRYRGQAGSPLGEPTHLQHWLAYRDGRPFGLNPQRTYPFLLGAPQPPDTILITALPPQAFLNALRPSQKQLVLELGSLSDSASAGEVVVTLYRRCLRICTAERDLEGPFEAGQKVTIPTAIPGGLVFVWEDSPPKDTRFRSDFAGATGQSLARGVPNLRWSYNARIWVEKRKVGEQEYPTLCIGSGLFRGWAEEWVQLALEGQPVLRFDLAYAPDHDSKQSYVPKPLVLRVLINGKQVWEETVPITREWQPREVPLTEYRGRKVLVTLSAENSYGDDIPASPNDRPALFGRVRVDHNPHSLALLSGADLPRPREVVYAANFAGPELELPWSAHISPANPAEAKIVPAGGMVTFLGKYYKYEYLSRPFPPEATVVQARVQVYPSGGAAEWNPGLGLYWGRGRYVFFTGGRSGEDTLNIRGWGARRIPLQGRAFSVQDDNRLDFWLRLALRPASLAFCSSLDGRAWTLEAEVPRPEAFAGPPQLLLLGRGSEGENEVFSNDAQWDTGLYEGWIGELILGRD